ncbi:pyridoxamine 5'-phosphate oxidase family protein [Tepidibacter hydrothermalis]|uniref:Pyridoxamine 5'-phosphate oxidase family protein n=1 Tax=Tepidibacter hydrothermalis TaxID=3036126 RepID=A0ABY8EGB7_9FIRM|nr:pyridoxamine 5'-phosphate oxidase family protein [Tepidibacter hydrothermalis]WFD11821.1 pyridoxamine 5'-phosphate oxidase family protein [Tepidibacter hydrothermalis]
MEKVMNFLKENPVFYFATIEGDKPKVRPFGFSMEFDGKLYFGIGKHKQSFQQILLNPNIEICTCNQNGSWIRISGKVVVDDRVEALDAAFTEMPKLKQMYNEETKMVLGLLYIEDAVAEIADMAGNFEKFII